MGLGLVSGNLHFKEVKVSSLPKSILNYEAKFEDGYFLDLNLRYQPIDSFGAFFKISHSFDREVKRGAKSGSDATFSFNISEFNLNYRFKDFYLFSGANSYQAFLKPSCNCQGDLETKLGSQFGIGYVKDSYVFDFYYQTLNLKFKEYDSDQKVFIDYGEGVFQNLNFVFSYLF